MPHVTLIVDGDCRLTQSPFSGAIQFDVPALSFWHTDAEMGGSAENVERCLVEDAKQKHPGLSNILKDPKFKGLTPEKRVAGMLREAMKGQNGKIWAVLRKVREHPAGKTIDLGLFTPEVVVP